MIAAGEAAIKSGRDLSDLLKEGSLAMNRPWLEFYDDDVPRTLEYAPVPVPECLHSSARRFP